MYLIQEFEQLVILMLSSISNKLLYICLGILSAVYIILFASQSQLSILESPKLKTSMKKQLVFAQSQELKTTFNALSEQWCRKYRLGLSDLAERCGVSTQYLSHIGRYGRIPSQPILLLLALNLEVKDPQSLFQQAGVNKEWPFEPGIGLRAQPANETGLLSINLDMHGFTNAIKEIVRAEVQPKRLDDLLKGKPLRVGLNQAQFFMFDTSKKADIEGFFPELLRTLALALQCEVQFIAVSFQDYAKKLSRGEIDCYGPIYATTSRLTHAPLTKSFCQVPLSGLARVKRISRLPYLPVPRKLSELREEPYVIAVHANTMAEHFAVTALGIPQERIISCSLAEEAVERIMLSNIPRPAHVMLTDAPFADKITREHGNAVSQVFDDADEDFTYFEDTIAIRADWPVLQSAIEQTLEMLKRNGTIKRLLKRYMSEHYSTMISLK